MVEKDGINYTRNHQNTKSYPAVVPYFPNLFQSTTLQPTPSAIHTEPTEQPHNEQQQVPSIANKRKLSSRWPENCPRGTGYKRNPKRTAENKKI